MPPVTEQAAQGFDKSAFPGPGHTGDSHPDRIAGVWQQLFQHLLRFFHVGRGVALDQGNRLGQNSPVSRQHTLYMIVCGKPAPAGNSGKMRKFFRAGPAGHAVVAALHSFQHMGGECGAGFFRNPLGSLLFFSHCLIHIRQAAIDLFDHLLSSDRNHRARPKNGGGSVLC